jgi:hypothetical protein
MGPPPGTSISQEEIPRQPGLLCPHPSRWAFLGSCGVCPGVATARFPGLLYDVVGPLGLTLMVIALIVIAFEAVRLLLG